MIGRFLLFILAISIFGCHKSEVKITKPVISVSIIPQKYFIQQIAGSYFEINVLIPSAASHDAYEPSPNQVKGLNNSKAYFLIGNIEFEKTWIDKFKSVNSDMKIFDMSDSVKIIEGDDNKLHIDNHLHNQDPHIWMSPRTVKIIAQNILLACNQIVPEQSELFNKNYLVFISQLDSIDNEIGVKLQQFKGYSFFIYHPALTYFARDYGLTQLSIELDGKQPSVSHLKNIVDEINTSSKKIVLIQKQFDAQLAESISKQTGAQLQIIDPFSDNWDKEILQIANYLQNAYK